MTLLMDPPAATPAAGQEAPLKKKYSAPLVQYAREHRCPRCDDPIPTHMVFGVLDEEKRARVVRIYCDACRAGFEASFVERGGMLEQTGPTRLVMGASLDEILAHVAAVRGDTDLRVRESETTTPEDPGTRERRREAVAEQRAAVTRQIEAGRRSLQRLHDARRLLEAGAARPLPHGQLQSLAADLADSLAEWRCLLGDTDDGPTPAGVPAPMAGLPAPGPATSPQPQPSPSPSPRPYAGTQAEKLADLAAAAEAGAGGHMSAGEDAHAESQRTIDRSTDQRDPRADDVT